MEQLIQKYKKLNSVGRIIAITSIVYILTQLWNIFLFLFEIHGYRWQDFLALPAGIQEFISHPWTLLSYMFVHADFSNNPFHLIFNMIWLYWFGQFFLRYHSGRQFLSLYITAGLFAGLFFLLCYNIFPSFSTDKYHTIVVGASGAIFALIVAVAIRQPNEILTFNLFLSRFNLKMKWIALAVLIISSMGENNIGGSVCHVGGAVWGAFYALSERKGKDITRWLNTFCDNIANLFKPKPRIKVSKGGKSTWKAERQKDMDYNQQRKEHEKRIDSILDKMRKSGYNGLTEEEKRYLFEARNK